MNWARAKNILILLLLAVNLVLGGIWLFREAQLRAVEANADGELCAVLLQNGLTVKPEILSKATALTYDMELSEQMELAAAECLLGELGASAQYESAKGIASFRAMGAFEMLLNEGFPLSELPQKAKDMGFEGEAVTDKQDIIYNQYIRGLPVWDYAAVFTQTGGTVAMVSGRWLWGETLPVSDKPCYSAGYCLLELTESWDSTGELEVCELGFAAEALAAGVVRLKPCWRFVISGVEYLYPAAQW